MSDLTYSSEMVMYPLFYRQNVLRKLTDFNRVWNRRDIRELPRGCVLHLVDDNFLVNKPIVLVPELDNWTFNMAPNIKFLNHITNPVGGPVPIPEQFRLLPNGLVQTIVNFRKQTMSYVRPWKDVPKMPANTLTQAVLSYNSLYRAKVIGIMKNYRRFNYVMATILNLICQMPEQNHFIPIPVGNVQYEKADFMMAFREYTKATIRRPNDPWYALLMNLTTFMHVEDDHHSLFSYLPEKILPRIHFIFYSKTNMVITTLQNLKEFNKGKTDLVLVKFLKQMGALALQGQIISSTDFGVRPVAGAIDTEIEEEITEQEINSDDLERIIEVKERPESEQRPSPTLAPDVSPDEVVSRPRPEEGPVAEPMRFSMRSLVPDLKRYAKIVMELARKLDFRKDVRTEIGIRDRLVKAITNLSRRMDEDAKPPVAMQGVAGGTPSEDVQETPPVEIQSNLAPENAKPEMVKSETLEDILESPIPEIQEVRREVVTIRPTLVNNGRTIVNAPAYTKAPSESARKAFDASTTDEIDARAAETIMKATHLTKAQEDRAVRLAEAYKEIELNGKTLQSILNESPDDQVSKNELDFLKGQVPDESMLKSSVANFDTEYMDKFFMKDLVAVLTSFNKVGMFLKDLKITDTSNSQDSKMEVKATYEDLNHKTHTVRFTVPKVDKRGYCYINGGLKVLKKQRITVPICKVSPVRVTLSSDYNKYLVERVKSVAHSFINYIDKIVEVSEKKIKVVFGSASLPTQPFPYEYTAIARKYTAMTITDQDDSRHPWIFHFNDPAKLVELYGASGIPEDVVKDAQANEDDVKGYLVGIHNTQSPVYVYMKLDGSLVLYNAEDGVTNDGSTFIDLVCELCNLDISHLNEWTEFKLLSKSVPVIFALAYRYGLSYMLNYMKTKYAIYDKKARYPRRQSDVIIKFKDKVLVIPRAPLSHSLIFAGLNNYEKFLLKYNIEDMDDKNTYFELLQSKKMSVHNLKGIDNYFDLFVDPITRDVLFRMGEPTDAKDLLIRATTLLTTEDHPPVAASTNYRFRSDERICTAAYKVLANTYATFRYRGIGASNTFSIRDFEITNMVINDQLMEPVEQINPVNDVKYREEYGHGGAGGRQSTDTFMIDDRQWPEDGVGIIGESSVDNGKTGYAGNMSCNPTIDNIRGLTINKKLEDITTSEAFTSTTLLGPCAVNDDSKRVSFLNIHLSHYVATKEMSLPRVRTGYERVMAHRCKPPFSYTAEEDGVIETINEESHMLVVSYPKSKRKISVEYGDLYTNNGGGGFYCTQNIVINGFKEGDKVKRGDVIVYNDRFFKPDPFTKQVDLSFGQLANVAIIDMARTVEDSDIISAQLAKKLEFNPVHPRDIVITKSTTIHKYAAVGTAISNVDPLMIFDQSAITDDMFGGVDDETAELLAKVNRETPRAKFTGRVVKIDAFYLGDTSEMSPSARNLVNLINREKTKKASVSKGTDNEADYPATTNITDSARIGATVLEEDTLIIRFYIQQDMSMGGGDKVEFDSSLKSVSAGTVEHGWDTEDGSVTCDALFSAVGIHKRLINSPIQTGIMNRNLEKIEKDVLEMYFGK